jgi:hypothetical protein
MLDEMKHDAGIQGSLGWWFNLSHRPGVFFFISRFGRMLIVEEPARHKKVRNDDEA